MKDVKLPEGSYQTIKGDAMISKDLPTTLTESKEGEEIEDLIDNYLDTEEEERFLNIYNDDPEDFLSFLEEYVYLSDIDKLKVEYYLYSYNYSNVSFRFLSNLNLDNIDCYHNMTLEDVAYEFLEEQDIPREVLYYIDIDLYVRDNLLHEYDEYKGHVFRLN